MQRQFNAQTLSVFRLFFSSSFFVFLNPNNFRESALLDLMLVFPSLKTIDARLAVFLFFTVLLTCVCLVVIPVRIFLKQKTRIKRSQRTLHIKKMLGRMHQKASNVDRI